MSRPHDANAERAVLGAAILNPTDRKAVIALPTTVFHFDGHRVIHGVLRDAEKHGLPVDVGTVTRLVAEHPKAAAVEALGDHYVSLLDPCATENVPRYCELLLDLEHRRRIVAACRTAATDVTRGTIDAARIENDLMQAVQSGRRRAASSPWAAIRPASALLNEPDPDSDFLVGRILARGSLTLWFSPRGLGKTHVAHWLAVELAHAGKRVLIIDRDNARRELKRRLGGWGAGGVGEHLKVIDRDDAPPLTNRSAWDQFPFGEYDLVILDAFDSSAEGVGEQDSTKPSLAVAVLLNLAHRADGPAVLVLGNTIKSGAHGRGSGVIEDRADIVYEVRDATDLRPTGARPWFQELPSADRGSWADRAARRKRHDTYRLAFVPTKYRVGEEPEPFVFEARLAIAPWQCEDVTAALESEGEAVVRGKAESVTRGLESLAAEVARRPIPFNSEAVPMLEAAGASRDDARRLILDRVGLSWQVAGSGRRGDPRMLIPAGETRDRAAGNGNTENHWAIREPIPAGRVDTAPQETMRLESASGAVAEQGVIPADQIPAHVDSERKLLARHDWDAAGAPNGLEPNHGAGRPSEPDPDAECGSESDTIRETGGVA